MISQDEGLVCDATLAQILGITVQQIGMILCQEQQPCATRAIRNSISLVLTQHGVDPTKLLTEDDLRLIYDVDVIVTWRKLAQKVIELQQDLLPRGSTAGVLAHQTASPMPCADQC